MSWEMWALAAIAAYIIGGCIYAKFTDKGEQFDP